MMIHSTRTTITPRTIQPVVDMKGSWWDGKARPPRRARELGRSQDDVGLLNQQKKTPGSAPGVYSPSGGSGGKGGCHPAIYAITGQQRGNCPVVPGFPRKSQK